MDNVTNLTPAGAIAIAVTQIKAFLPERLHDDPARYNAIVRLIAIALGVAGFALDYLINHPAATAGGLEQAVKDGAILGAAAIVLYHLVAEPTITRGGEKGGAGKDPQAGTLGTTPPTDGGQPAPPPIRATEPEMPTAVVIPSIPAAA